MKKILFLGYGRSETDLIDVLVSNNCTVHHTDQRLETIETIESFDCVISYGYRYILPPSVLDDFSCPAFNLHISYLPYNRGAHPNFWAFYDNTPSGVTIHLISDGLDTGPIVRQRAVSFRESDDTFAKTYSVLINNLEDLFLEFLPSLLTDSWVAEPQKGLGTYHNAKDLPINFSGWDSNIADEIGRLRKV